MGTTASTSCPPLRRPTVFEWRPGDGGPHSFVVDPADLGLSPARPEELKGGDPAYNAAATRAVLSGAPGPHRDIVLLNAAAALVVVGQATDLAQGMHPSPASLDSGRPPPASTA